jgi:hypothetical protein
VDVDTKVIAPVGPDPSAGRRNPWATRRVALVVSATVLATAVIVAGSWAWHWRTHPEVFPGDGNGIGATLHASRDTLYIGVTYPYPGRGDKVTIDSAEPRIVANTADATFDFYLCTLDVSGSDFSAFGVAGRRLSARMCPDPVPLVRGMVLDVGADPPQQLVVRITVHRPGVLRTRGVDLTYSHGWQHGTQAIAEHLTIRSR